MAAVLPLAACMALHALGGEVLGLAGRALAGGKAESLNGAPGRDGQANRPWENLRRRDGPDCGLSPLLLAWHRTSGVIVTLVGNQSHNNNN